MENLTKQRRRRVMFSEREEEHFPSWLPELVTADNTALNWLREQSYWYEKNDHYDEKEGQFAVAVAATTFAIGSLEEAEQEKRKIREELNIPQMIRSKKTEGKRIPTMSKEEGKNIRRLDTQEVKIKGDNYTKKPSNITPENRKTQQISSSSRRSGLVSATNKVDSWEKTQIEKIVKRYDKMKAAIVAWENEKKLAARLKMEKRKSENEKRKEINNQHYRSKVSRIEIIAGGAKRQLEEKRRSEEAEVKGKAKKMRRTARLPVDCFCFRCY